MATRPHPLQLGFEPRTEVHCHSRNSDGYLEPAALVAKAVDAGIEVLSLTDHDTTGGVNECSAACVERGIRFVPGCECTVSEDGREHHLLAYAFDVHNAAFQDYLAHTRGQRVRRCEAILAKLAALGAVLQMEDVLRFAEGQSVVRPHIAAALRDKGYVQTNQEAFERFLANDAPAYVPIEEQRAEEAIEIIHAACGLAVFAHPGLTTTQKRVVELIDAGLDGIEVRHPSHTRSHQRLYHKLCKEYKVLETGGSDFHGNRFYDDMHFGRYNVSADVAERLLDCTAKAQEKHVQTR